MKKQVIISKEEFDNNEKELHGLRNEKTFILIEECHHYYSENHYLFKKDVDRHLRKRIVKLNERVLLKENTIEKLEKEIRKLKQRKWYKLW